MKALIPGFFTPWIVYAVVTLMHCLFKGRQTEGYVRHDQSGKLLTYRLNGFLILFLSIVLWFLLGLLTLVPLDYLYQVRWASLAGAGVFGILFSFVMVLPFPSTGKSFFADLWFGRLKNPQTKNGFIDAKMWLCLTGTVMLQLNILSFAAHHWLNNEVINPGFILGTVLLTWFIWDSLSFEKVHLYTYDFIAERVGFKLGFGRLAFYPYFYAVALWSTVNLPDPQQPVWRTACFAVVFFAGWFISRNANLQKYYFKISPHRRFFGKKPVVLTDGNHSLLASGFWGCSRHINYLGEIFMACGIALAAGYPAVWQVWLYPLYYILFLCARQRADDRVCKAKYGDLWDTYTKKVKSRIIPFIY